MNNNGGEKHYTTIGKLSGFVKMVELDVYPELVSSLDAYEVEEFYNRGECDEGVCCNDLTCDLYHKDEDVIGWYILDEFAPEELERLTGGMLKSFWSPLLAASILPVFAHSVGMDGVTVELANDISSEELEQLEVKR